MCQMVPMSVHDGPSVSVHLHSTHICYIRWSTGVIISLHRHCCISWIPMLIHFAKWVECIVVWNLHKQNMCVCLDISCCSASHDNWCPGAVLNRIITAQWEGMGDVGSARYEPALLPPCPTIRVLSYSNCQRATHSIYKWIFRNLAL